MKIKRNTVQWRCKQWGEWLQDPNARAEVSRLASPFGRIARDRNAAGSFGEGIRYEIIDGVSCKPDGGMAAAAQRDRDGIMRSIRCRETHDAVSMLPPGMQRVIVHTYVVPGGEPRSQRAVAELLGISQSTIREQVHKAHERIARRIYGPFEFADEQADDDGQEHASDEMLPADER